MSSSIASSSIASSSIARRWKARKALGIAVAAAAVLLAVRGSTSEAEGQDQGTKAKAGPCRSSATLPSPARPQIDCPAPPNTFDGSSFFGGGASAASMAQAGPTFDAWAWSSFVAFNWPAKADSSQPTGFLRGVPDVGQTFAGAKNDDVLVWETFKEKREIFNDEVAAGQWQDITFSQDQALDFQSTPSGLGKVPACTPRDREAALKLGHSGHRRVLQASKVSPAIDGDNTLDETAEVASPAQESQDALCAGYTGAALRTCQETFSNPPNGDSSTPFPPTERNPRVPVGPRVFEAASGDILYYEVKLNYDYYNFVTSPPKLPDGSAPPGPYNIDANAFEVAHAKNMTLPYRTSAAATPSTTSPQPPLSVLSYDADQAAAAYAGTPATPPAVGSVQIKTAWQVLPPNDPGNADFHVSEAVFFSTDPSAPPENVCYRVGTFGLVGIHIIQRIHLGSAGATAQSVGGTYVFATWEHVSIGDGTPYRYVNFLADQGLDQTDPTPYPTLDHAIQVRRQQPYPLDSTREVTEAVWSQLPSDSLWRNYRLIGTQFLAAPSESDSSKYNQPYYLANLVIETNDGLQNFQGLPPGLFPIPAYEKLGVKPTGGNPPLYFEPSFANVVFERQPRVMGGCMGCHGVAQANGYDFSFVLQDGQQGAGIDTPSHVAIPPQPPSPDPPPGG